MNSKPKENYSHWRGPGLGLISAALFGASTPFGKLLLGQMSPQWLAGLLYLGSGIGLGAWWLLDYLLRGRNRGEDSSRREAPLSRSDLPWLTVAILCGGITAPVMLMFGLRATEASTASLLLNLEGVFTSLLAWSVFRENFDKRILLGMLAILSGGMLLSWAGRPEAGVPWSSLLIASACLCWALDNNFTRKVSATDPVQIAALKGLTAGVVNVSIALAGSDFKPSLGAIGGAAVLGLASYGVSLVCFIYALRFLGTARAGAYFSTAPFIGAALSFGVMHDRPSGAFWAAAVLMAAGVWLHLTERHEHWHEHEGCEHAHAHIHDEHHHHDHLPTDPPGEPHTHLHRHEPLRHCHPHYPDIHHRHKHGSP